MYLLFFSSIFQHLFLENNICFFQHSSAGYYILLSRISLNLVILNFYHWGIFILFFILFSYSLFSFLFDSVMSYIDVLYVRGCLGKPFTWSNFLHSLFMVFLNPQIQQIAWNFESFDHLVCSQCENGSARART